MPMEYFSCNLVLFVEEVSSHYSDTTKRISECYRTIAVGCYCNYANVVVVDVSGNNVTSVISRI